MKRVQVMTETISRIFKAFHGDAKLYFQSGVLKNGSRQWLKISRKCLIFSSHYSKSQIFVQKFNFDETPTFSKVFPPNFF